ncbi:MAG: cation transporter [Clostridia bacterium]|nr:cation transporter [Clostridia bacterium]
MKSDGKILIAFALNLFFSVFEYVGGMVTGSVAIISDALHDFGDAVSVGISYFLEKKSKMGPDARYTYGYGRYSVLGGLISALILLFGSGIVIYSAVARILAPREIDYNGMLIFAIVGVCVNAGAAFFTREGKSLNQKAVNLHMLEDVFGWLAVLIGAVVMRFVDFPQLDPILSIGIAVFILVHAISTLKEGVDIFLEKAPAETDAEELAAHILKIEGVLGVHHIHLWSLDGQSHLLTLHAVAEGDGREIRDRIREEAREHGVCHVTVELECPGETCGQHHCHVEPAAHGGHGHHHHHHHSRHFGV